MDDSDLIASYNMKSSHKDRERFPGYTKLTVVGKGAFGTAVLYRREADTKEVVIKEVNIMDMPPEEKKSALNEVKVLSALDHPHIIKYFGSFEHEGSLFIEMEYADGGTLAQFLDTRIQEKRKIKEQDILYLFRQVSGAIAYMHKHKILHRDLKTANIFLTKKFTAKVGDFGISKMMSTLVQAQTVVGTPYYLSPEMCEGVDYDEKSDIWALGCILYEMTELRKPFEAHNLPALVTKIITCDFEPISRRYSDALSQLINQILQKNSAQRPSAKIIYSSIIPHILQEVDSRELKRALQQHENQMTTERSVLYELKGFKDEFSLQPIQLPARKLIHVAVGSSHCLAITEDFSVYSWGDNRNGQLGLGELAPWRNYPIRIDSLTGKNIKQVACGNGFSIFLNNIGLLMSCGDGRQGCLGHGDWSGIAQPRIMNRMISVNITQVQCGTEHVLALSVNGELYSWGCGKDGRLGSGDEDYRCTPTIVKLPRGQKVRSIYCGGNGSMIITTNGQLLACGLNTNNKLALSTIFQHIEKSLHFIPVRNVKQKIIDVSMGEHHTILISEMGNVITLGRNTEGQLGRGHCKPKAQPEAVQGLQKRTKVASCGTTYSVVGTMDNVIYFWGTRYEYDNKHVLKSTGSSGTVVSVKPYNHKQTFYNVTAEECLSSTSTSVNFSSDIVRLNEPELIKTPKSILGLYASPKHVASGELVWLVNVFAFQSSILVWVNTTVQPPLAENNGNEMSNKEMVSKWMSFETIQKELLTLPNTPQPD